MFQRTILDFNGTAMIMKVLIIANYRPSVGGISGQVALLHKYLNKEGFKVDIFSTKARMLSRFKIFYSLCKIANKYDVLHVHCCSYFGFFPLILGVTIAKKLRKKLICTYHGGDAKRFFRKYTRLVKHYLNRTDHNIVLSGFLANIFDQYEINYQIIPNIVEMDRSVYRERNEIKPKYISVRSLSPIYNIECIIRAFAIVKEVKQDAKLFILGDGVSRSELESLVLKLGVSDVHFKGLVPNTDIYDYLSQADIFISMPKIDNQPMSVLEAYNNGLLVISSRVGGVPYLVDDNRTGILVESDNHVELAEKMLWAVNNPEQSIEMIRAGKKELDKYRWDNIKDKIFALYSFND